MRRLGYTFAAACCELVGHRAGPLVWHVLLVEVVGLATAQAQELRWPLVLTPTLSSTFGETRSTAFHNGIDLKTWGKTGYPVHAAADGWVERARTSPWGFGRVIYVRLNDGRIVVYAHLDSFYDPVQKRIFREQRRLGQYSVQLWFEKEEYPVRRGEVIGATGQTGAGPPHLHFELRDGGNAPMNPLLHAFEVADTESPTLRRLLVVPRGAGSLADGGHDPVVVPLRWHAQSQRFRAVRDVRVFGRVGIGVESFDTADAADNPLAPLSHSLILGGQEVFSSRLQRVSFSSGHQVALDRWRIGNLVFFTLFQRPGNRLPFYSSDGNAGWLLAGGEPMPPGEHPIEVVAKDVAGNESRAQMTLLVDASFAEAMAAASPSNEPAPEFEVAAHERFAVITVRGTAPTVRVSDQEIHLHPQTDRHAGLVSYAHFGDQPGVQAADVVVHFGPERPDTTVWLTLQTIRPGEARTLLYDAGRMALHVDAGSAYEETVPQVTSVEPVASPGLRATELGFIIEPATASFDKWARISFPVPDGMDAEHLGVYVSDRDGGWVFIGNDLDGTSGPAEAPDAKGPTSNRVSARIRAFGHFALLEDRAPPTISMLAPRSQTWLDERRPLLRARVVDRGSGIGKEEDLAIELNGRPLIHIYDPEADLVEARPDQPLADGEYAWTVRASDQAGNQAEASSVFGLR